MPKSRHLSREDEVTLRLLKTPPKPFTPKAKKKPTRAKKTARTAKRDD